MRFYKSDMLSISSDLTNDICTPKPRCVPAHLRQMKMPLFTEIHWGESAPHSKHLLFDESRCSNWLGILLTSIHFLVALRLPAMLKSSRDSRWLFRLACCLGPYISVCSFLAAWLSCGVPRRRDGLAMIYLCCGTICIICAELICDCCLRAIFYEGWLCFLGCKLC